MQLLDTVSALEVVGVNRTVWNDALAKGHYTEAPKTVPGKKRYFDRDDLVALKIFDDWTRLVDQKTAGLVASAVRKELRRTKGNVDFLWIVSTKSRVPRYVVSVEPPRQLTQHRIDVGLARREVDRTLAEMIEP